MLATNILDALPDFKWAYLLLGRDLIGLDHIPEAIDSYDFHGLQMLLMPKAMRNDAIGGNVQYHDCAFLGRLRQERHETQSLLARLDVSMECCRPWETNLKGISTRRPSRKATLQKIKELVASGVTMSPAAIRVLEDRASFFDAV
jgi:hypothetical protein